MIDIARPYASEMKLLKPALTKEFNHYVPFRISFMLTLTVFIVSTALHLIFMYIYHRYNLASKLFPSLLDKNKKRVRAKPMMKLETTDSHAEDKFHKKFGRIYHLSRSQSKRNLNEPSTSANCDQVLMQSPLDPRMASSMFEYETTAFKQCQPIQKLQSSIKKHPSNCQVTINQKVPDTGDFEADQADTIA